MNRDQTDPARGLRERIRQTMAMHNRCDVEISELLKVWENQVEDDLDTVEDFMRWCGRVGWKAGRGVTVPRFIITK
jgi:hypothetical protein